MLKVSLHRVVLQAPAFKLEVINGIAGPSIGTHQGAGVGYNMVPLPNDKDTVWLNHRNHQLQTYRQENKYHQLKLWPDAS